MSTLDISDSFSPTTPSWRARVRFVRDLAPAGAGVFMAPDRSMVLRLNDHLYTRALATLAVVPIAWVAALLMLAPVVSPLGFVSWSLLLTGSMGLVLMGRLNAPRPMHRPGAASAWASDYIANLWVLSLALGVGVLLVYPETMASHQRALCLILISVGSAMALMSSSSVRGLAATLGPTIGLPTLILMARGLFDLAAFMALAGGIAVLVGLVIFHITADRARNDVESA